jgi:hypothetical protein
MILYLWGHEFSYASLMKIDRSIGFHKSHSTRADPFVLNMDIVAQLFNNFKYCYQMLLTFCLSQVVSRPCVQMPDDLQLEFE